MDGPVADSKKLRTRIGECRVVQEGFFVPESTSKSVLAACAGFVGALEVCFVPFKNNDGFYCDIVPEACLRI